MLRQLRGLIGRGPGPQATREQFAADLGLTPIGSYHAEDVFVVGYPRSGNTWFQNIVAGLYYGADPELAPHGLINEMAPDVHGAAFYRRYSTPMIFKSHALPDPAYRRVAYLLRDGRDAMVSYSHFLRSRYLPELDFLEMVEKGDSLFPCKWHDHVEAWLANPHDAEMIVIRYEDLQREPVAQLKRFCSFVGLTRDEELLSQLAEKTRFDRLRAKEVVDVESDDSAEKRFFRRGEVGCFRDEMPADVLQAFMKDAEPTLRRCGYLDP
jgi:hypothetical protein